MCKCKVVIPKVALKTKKISVGCPNLIRKHFPTGITMYNKRCYRNIHIKRNRSVTNTLLLRYNPHCGCSSLAQESPIEVASDLSNFWGGWRGGHKPLGPPSCHMLQMHCHSTFEHFQHLWITMRSMQKENCSTLTVMKVCWSKDHLRSLAWFHQAVTWHWCNS